MNSNVKDYLEENINNLLIEAMNSELQAKKFYKEASLKAQSQAGKNLFNELADFEQKHYEKIKKIIESRNKQIKIQKPEIRQDDIKLRSEAEGEFEPNKDEIVSIINIAIDAEKKAQEIYSKIADIIEDDEIKNIFINLARDEQNHQKILEDEFYQLSNKGTIIWE
jgi:rubrerythrin